MTKNQNNTLPDSNFIELGDIFRDCSASTQDFELVWEGTAADVLNDPVWNIYSEDDGRTLILNFGDQNQEEFNCDTENNDGNIAYDGSQTITIIIEEDEEIPPPTCSKIIFHEDFDGDCYAFNSQLLVKKL